MDSAAELRDPSSPAIDITFKNVIYSVQVHTQLSTFTVPCLGTKIRKQILKGVSGIFKAGEVTAIMGSSGAGKTTLLNVLAGRISLQSHTGDIRANDTPYSFQNFGDFANYVMQQDILMQTMTVRETLRFAADLKLNASEDAKDVAIKQLAKNLKLESCLDTLVGGLQVKGISGGQKKRTSIAYELISDPQVLMLDEPTSGLDSLTSFIIVRYIHDLARLRNKTIIMTIHQPNSEIFALFDKLVLMVEGSLIYQGPAATATFYFSKEFGLTCPEFHNPTDYFMSIMHQEAKENVDRYPIYNSSYERNFSKAIQAGIQGRNRDVFQRRQTAVNSVTTYCTLLRRDIKNIIRNPLMIKSRFFQTIVLALYIGGLFCKFGPNYTDPIAFHALTGFFCFLSVNSVFIALTPIALLFPQERTVFLKEQSAKLYGPVSYFMSKNTVQLPYGLFFPALQTLIMYWFVGLSSTPGQFFTFYLIVFLSNLCGMSMGMLAGTIADTPRGATGAALLIMIPFFVFSGFFKNLRNLPGWVGWIQYLSPFKYGFTAFTWNEVLNRKSNIALLNFDTGLWESIGILAGLGMAARLLSLFFLWKFKARIE